MDEDLRSTKISRNSENVDQAASSSVVEVPSVELRGSMTHLFLVLLAILVVDLAESSVQPYLQQYAVVLQAAPLVAGLSVSVHQLARAGVGPLAGMWTDRAGKRRPFALGIAVVVASYVVGYLAQDIAWLIASRVLLGVGYALVSITMMAQVGSCLSVRRRGLGYSIFINITAGSMILAPLLGGMVAQLYGFRAVFAMTAFLAAVGVVFTGLLPKSVKLEGGDPRGLGLGGSLRAVARSRNALATAVELFGIGLGWISFLLYVIPVYGRQALGLDNLQIGVLISIVGASHLISSMVAGPLSDMLRSRRPFVFGGIFLAGVTLFATPLAHDFFGLASIVAAWAFFVGLQCPTSLALVADSVNGVILGSAMGVISGIEMSAMFLGPVLCALILSSFGLGSIYLIPAIGMTVPGVLFALISTKPADQ